MKKINVAYANVIDVIKPSLEELADLSYSEDTPISHILNIVENLKVVDDRLISFWDIREKILLSLVELDDNGLPKENEIETQEGVSKEFVLTFENRTIWNKKFKELRETELILELTELEKEHFQGAKGIKPNSLRGCLSFLK